MNRNMLDGSPAAGSSRQNRDRSLRRTWPRAPRARRAERRRVGAEHAKQVLRFGFQCLRALLRRRRRPDPAMSSFDERACPRAAHAARARVASRVACLRVACLRCAACAGGEICTFGSSRVCRARSSRGATRSQVDLMRRRAGLNRRSESRRSLTINHAPLTPSQRPLAALRPCPDDKASHGFSTRSMHGCGRARHGRANELLRNRRAAVWVRARNRLSPTARDPRRTDDQPRATSTTGVAGHP